MSEQVRFEKGDVVRHKGCYTALERGAEYTVTEPLYGGQRIMIGHRADGEIGWDSDQFELVRRASESQREGGWILHGTAWAGPGCAYWNDGLHGIHNGPGGLCSCGLTLEQAKELGHVPADPAPAQPVEPPQPAPMTRAARVLQDSLAEQSGGPVVPAASDSKASGRVAPSGATSGHLTRAEMVRDGLIPDPYRLDPPMALIPGTAERNEAARLRMAKWSLDRPLEHDPKKWALLTGPCHPVTGRPVGRR